MSENVSIEQNNKITVSQEWQTPGVEIVPCAVATQNTFTGPYADGSAGNFQLNS